MFILVFITGIAIRPAAAQTYRAFGAGALVTDDNHGHTLTLQTPQPGDPGYSDWILNGSLLFKLPIPPVNGASMAFMLPGPSTLGPDQVPIWDPPTSVGGTGGSQGVWRSTSLLSAISSVGLITGSGTANSLAKWTGAGTVANSSISETGGAVTFGGYGAGVLHSDAGGTITSSPVVLTADVNGTLPATNGGTGNNTYATGDILYASSPTTLSRLPAGGMNQVLGTSGSTPAWITNGATVTNTTNTPASLTINTNDYTIDPSSTYIRLSNISGSSLDVTGISSAGVANGRMITLVNTSANPIILRNQNGASSSNDQFDLPGNADIMLAQKGTATFIYDATLHFWELVSTN